MLPSFETNRLLLRPRSLVDLDACLAMNAEPDVMRYVGGMPANMDDYAATLVTRISRPHPSGLGYWSLFAKQNPQYFLGWVSLVLYDYEDPGSNVEIGWRVPKTAWGNGYATEAASVVLRYAFGSLGLKRVIATMDPGNVSSFRVAEKIGMTFVGDGDYFGTPCKVYAMEQSDLPTGPAL
jgi:RimJ/RimL family protein N-acetyltransferase